MKIFLVVIATFYLAACDYASENRRIISRQELVSVKFDLTGKKLEAVKATIANLEEREISPKNFYVEVEKFEETVVVLLIDKAFSNTVHVGGGGETQECTYDLVKKEIKECLYYQ